MTTEHAPEQHSGDHDEHLAHHFESKDQQLQSAKLGMWIFIATEILFFGGLLCAYAVYRSNHPDIFVWAHHFLDKTLGAVNTIILICSSLTAAWAVRAAQLRQARALALMLGLTLALAAGFLGIKYVEYSHKWHHGLLWAGSFDPHLEDEAGDAGHGSGSENGPESAPSASEQEGGSAAAEPMVTAAPDQGDPGAEVARQGGADEMSAIRPAALGPPGLAKGASTDASTELAAHQQHPDAPRNAQVFFSIYFLLTGLHGIHVLGGMAAMIWLLLRVRRGDFSDGYYTPVDMVALYWHLVDLIWIYLFLLLYLIH